MKTFLLCLALLYSLSLPAATADMSKYYLDDEKISSTASKLLFATHLSREWDRNQSSADGAAQAIQKAKAQGYEINYLIPWAFEEANKPGNDLEFDRLLALYESSRPDFIRDVTPFIQKKMLNYFLPDILGDRYIGSYSGVIYDLKIPRASEVVVLGEHAPVIKIVGDAIYESCSSNDDAPTTISTCRTKSPDHYKNSLRIIEDLEARFPLIKFELVESADI